MKKQKNQIGRFPTPKSIPQKASHRRCSAPLTVLSPAKINLTLDVLGIEKAPGPHRGYHFVDTVTHEIGLVDELKFESFEPRSSRRPSVTLKCSDPSVPLDERNTIMKAVSVLLNGKNIKKSANLSDIKITLKKNIPPASGLGGGSSNAAATLKALNHLWGLKLSTARLRLLAAKIGMDAPFFIEGGTARCTHYGEKVRNLPAVKLPPYIIVMDDKKSSTKAMYDALDGFTSKVHTQPTLLFSASEVRSSSEVCDALYKDIIFNALQSPKTLALKKKLLQLGATVVQTCGSGPALYALFRSEMIKRKVYKELKGQVRFIWQNQNKN